MTAETLRRAAALMRERAEAATEGTWLADDEAPGIVMAPDSPGFTWDGVFVCSTDCPGGPPNAPDANHIASWHPAVALAVAELLDREAAMCEVFLIDEDETPDALSVARAYLGEASA